MSSTRVAIDGRIVPPEEARISVFDRGFLYGDSVFEVMRTYGGRPYAEREHLERLTRSAARVLIEVPVSLSAIEAEIAQTLEAAGNDESYVRVVLTRGSGPLSLLPDESEEPTRVIIVAPLPTPPDEIYSEGVAVVLIKSTRPTDYTRAAGAKASNYLANLLATHEAKQRGGHEAILTDPSGEVLEGATSNVFAVTDGVVRTPRLETGILGGITRATVLEAAHRADIPVVEDALFPRDLYEADEVFITSSIREVVPVVRVDGRAVGGGRPGPIAVRLLGAYRDTVRSSLALGGGRG